VQHEERGRFGIAPTPHMQTDAAYGDKLGSGIIHERRAKKE
jgi:hypothetical protein